MNLEFTIKRPLDHVYSCLTDMQKFVSVHPVIYKMNQIAPTEYQVFERLKFGFIPYSFKYKASVQGNPQAGTVNISATVMRLVKIEMRYTLTEFQNNTVVKESVQFNTILPLKGMMEGIFRTQHKLLFANIENLA